ncbi:TPA: DUF4097 family beta strand repeat protein [Streptococcus suis]|uniref:DUF4097 family beta strand repeat-containing protein n=1 Tax=Streptococcus suis TaxID=1307 RepID=UPI000CF5B170|nr:DUF4097 family beta strand repeat-containing protein [Streptococcus suis]HEM5199127.1 DUF4097 family beta strand repeat protein [Streptococcus suis]HEM5250306.1 DUF4097 family beta strand repeat protein [Streptococcus suis]HEM5311977.1 DUF4097 family beta strand repeat protein [Streptococcus suis]HEM6556790.1 DUF4097 family beta strand repeat protein [Streptococcus suis]HEM6590427.1 DUF4097 family beta strand repeat protein [Streptococcus suis]
MKKKLTIAIIIGFVSLIAGLILAGIGFFTGGVTRLEEVAAPTEVHKTFTDLNTIKIDFIPHNVYIKESSDSNYHVTYANSDNNMQSPLKLAEKEGTLTLSSQQESFAIEGIMQYLGERLAQRRINVFSVTIEVPKGKTLDKLEGEGLHFYEYGSFVIENVHIQEVDLSAGIFLDNAQIDSGKITAGYFEAVNSALRNTSISANESSVNLIETSLENVTIKNYQELNANQLTLLGKNVLTPSEHSLSVTNINLTDKSLQDINLNISTQLDIKTLAEHLGYHYETLEELKQAVGDMSYFNEQAENVGIFTKDKYQTLSIKKEEDKQTLTLEKKESNNSLIITSTNATINLRTPTPK